MAYMHFDSSQIAPQDDITPIPAGTYNAVIEDSEVTPTKAGTGQVLRLTWRVLDGPYINRKVWDRINVQNQNPTAEQIGQRALSSICHATGVLQFQDTSQLHGIPVQIKVSIRKDQTGQYSDSNEVKAYAAAHATAPRPQAAPAAFAPQGPVNPPPPPPQARPSAPWAQNRA